MEAEPQRWQGLREDLLLERRQMDQVDVDRCDEHDDDACKEGRRLGDEELAAASRMTQRRSTALMVALLDRLPGLREAAQALLTAVQPDAEGADEGWAKFCVKWGYDEKQRQAIREQLDAALSEKAPV